MIDSPKAMFDYLLNDPSFKDYQHIWSYVPSEIGWDDLVERYSEMSNVFCRKKYSTICILSI